MLVFVHINKTAGRTVRYILRSSYGLRHCEAEPWKGAWTAGPFTAQDLRRLRRIYPRLASIGGHRVTGHVDLGRADLRYFTFLRDPLKLTASRFQYHVEARGKRGLVFEDWLWRDWLRNPQTRQIGCSDDAVRALAVIRDKSFLVGLTERFDESLVLLRALMAPDLNLSYAPVNVARSNSLAAEILADPGHRRSIVEANAADVELYERVREDVYPRQAAAYGPGLEAAARELGRGGDFDPVRLTASRAKQFALYRPLLRLYRHEPTRGAVARLLG